MFGDITLLLIRKSEYHMSSDISITLQRGTSMAMVLHEITTKIRQQQPLFISLNHALLVPTFLQSRPTLLVLDCVPAAGSP